MDAVLQEATVHEEALSESSWEVRSCDSEEDVCSTCSEGSDEESGDEVLRSGSGESSALPQLGVKHRRSGAAHDNSNSSIL